MQGFDLHLMRHGAPEVTGLMLGRTDAAPTEGGIMACAGRAADLAFDQIVSSDLIRSERPARRIAEQRAMPVAIDARWRELDFGDWDGMATHQVESGALGRFWDDPDANPPPGGERWSALVERVGAAIEALAQQPTLVITHGGAMRAALAHLCGLGMAQTWAFDLPYGALLSLRVWPAERWSAQVTGLRP